MKICFLFSLIFVALGSFSSNAFADAHCFCRAARPDGATIHDYGPIASYTWPYGAGDTEDCRVKCTNQISSEIHYNQTTWNGSTWDDTTTVCAWTGGSSYNIRAKYKVGTDDWTFSEIVIASGFSCTGEHCPDNSYYSPNTFYGPYTFPGSPYKFTYNNVSILMYDGPYGVVTNAQTVTATSCPTALKANYKCVYHQAKPSGDQCFGVNPPSYADYAAGTPITIGTTGTPSCPPPAYPTYIYKTVDADILTGTGVVLPSSLDQCSP